MHIFEFIIQILAAMAGALGFSFMFNSGRKNLIPSVIGGALCWLIYIVCREFSVGFFVSALITAAVCQSYSEILARAIKTPAIVIYIPSIIPLVPGGSLYYTMYYAAISDWSNFAHYGWQTLQIALGIAVGTSFISAVLLLFSKQKNA